MKILVLKVGIVLLRFVYFFIKLLVPTKNQVTFISRQAGNYSLDIDLLTKYMKENYPEYTCVVMHKEIGKGIGGLISYGFHMLDQMVQISGSRCVVLDGYCINISCLHHKKSLKVIQMWHALGSLKKFGFSILDNAEGRSSAISKAMHMHENYDYILTTSEISKGFFMEAFNAKESQMKVLGLPRMDFLQSKEEKQTIRKRFLEIYPECDNGKEMVLYGPTMRIGCDVDWPSVIEHIDTHRYNLLLKLHGGREIVVVDGNTIERGNHFYGMEALHLADYFISDYSAMIYEAAIAGLPIYLYIYDYDTYMAGRGTYIDFLSEMPGKMSKSMKEIATWIEEKDMNTEKTQEFIRKYVSQVDHNITAELCELIVSCCK
ncbi:MAG: CDP-glycerol glycerophosphotransferase family protein [Erysipelotrichaceae bacterium]|nr:CDP-glycerol glycerophosphotransferase family protein [Erysipelotrichaceae bacterium]